MSTAISLHDIKPCPICNGNNVFCEKNLERESKYFVLCNDCGFEGKEFFTRGYAISNWNERIIKSR
ncbi:Lar family restriction alleviation protein [Aliivibrio fischeri]|uniref:Lar family restriction alleviation protein n=1 Tax=Aliivibrio fischeri TaxID=668 RepID=UPI0012DAB133|nr:hypothetical protein [Aliivibrio fischeri]